MTNVLSCGTEEENVGFNDLGYVSRSSLHRSRKKRDVSISDRKAKLKIAKFYVKLKDTRRDFLHKLSTEMSVKTKQLF